MSRSQDKPSITVLCYTLRPSTNFGNFYWRNLGTFYNVTLTFLFNIYFPIPILVKYFQYVDHPPLSWSSFCKSVTEVRNFFLWNEYLLSGLLNYCQNVFHLKIEIMQAALRDPSNMLCLCLVLNAILFVLNVRYAELIHVNCHLQKHNDWN